MAKLIIIGLQGTHFYKKKLSIFKDKGKFFKKRTQYFIIIRSPPEAVSARVGADKRLIVNLF